jgi:parallel beta-helix repeat protein
LKEQIPAVSLALFLILWAITPPVSFLIDKHTLDTDRIVSTLALSWSPHDEIIIESNDDFVLQGWPGNGTFGNPYVISGLEIGTDGNAIHVKDVDCHFTITNCRFFSTAGPYNGQGVLFEGISNGKIENSTFDGIHGGAIIQDSNHCEVSRCLMNSTYIPILLTQCPDSVILNNTIIGRGIYVYGSSNCRIEFNTQLALDNEYPTEGFYLSGNQGCVVRNNTVSNNYYGIWLEEMNGCVLEGNKLHNNGLYFSAYEQVHYEISESDNYVNGLRLGYFQGTMDIVLDGSKYGQIILAGCDNATVRNGSFTNATVGCLAAYSSDCKLVNITARGNVFGLMLFQSFDIDVWKSTLCHNLWGIECDNRNNIDLINNTVVHNEMVGININYGIGCEIKGNLICDNLDLGIAIGGERNVICYNVIGRNGRNAFDYGTGNVWDDNVSLGNYWDDAIEGAVYLVPGPGGGIDRFPNGTAGTYTVFPTTTSPSWIGNLTETQPTMLQAAAVVASVIVIVGAAIFASRRKRF